MRSVVLILILFSTSFAGAAGVPPCKDKKKTLEYNSDMLLNYRDHLEPKFKTRGYIKGKIVKTLEESRRHIHLEVDFDGNLESLDDRIEVVYNEEFGELQDYSPGLEIVACGDFIVDPYSPLKAVLHWLHYSPKKGAHDDGYLAIDGVVYGLRTDL